MRKLKALLLMSALSALVASGSLKATPIAAERVASYIGFYVPWDPNSRTSLAEHASSLGVFAPQWISLNATDGMTTIQNDDEALEIIARTNPNIEIIPLVTNAHNGIWDAASVEAVISDPDARKTMIDALAAAASERRYRGYIFDFENISATAIAGLPGLLHEIRNRFAPQKLRVMVTVPLGDPTWPLKSLQDSGATIVLMSYDQCWASSVPGPIAGTDWFAATLSARLAEIDPKRVVVALGSYAYDWPNGQRAAVLSIRQAKQRTDDNAVELSRNEPGLNATFDYKGPNGTPHTVWMLDAPAIAKERAIATHYGVKSFGLWRLGLEDPVSWNALSENTSRHIRAAASPAPACEPLR